MNLIGPEQSNLNRETKSVETVHRSAMMDVLRSNPNRLDWSACETKSVETVRCSTMMDVLRSNPNRLDWSACETKNVDTIPRTMGEEVRRIPRTNDLIGANDIDWMEAIRWIE